MGAFNLKATLNCEAFATEHSSTAHFDVKSFVGLAPIVRSVIPALTKARERKGPPAAG